MMLILELQAFKDWRSYFFEKRWEVGRPSSQFIP